MLAFDLGETLLSYDGIPLDWSDHYSAALGEACAAAKIPADAALLERGIQALRLHNTRLQPRDQEVGSRAILGPILPGGLDEAGWQAFEAAFFEHFQRHARAYPESRDVLQALARRGQRIAVLTDVPYGMPRSFVQADLQAAGLDGQVDLLLTSVEAGWRKPHPQAFGALALALGVPAAELVYVGNEQKDVLGVHGVGGKAVVIDREGRRPDWGQDRTIRSLEELLDGSGRAPRPAGHGWTSAR
jgi:putative hydrolase of the HAD superfamily